MDTKAQSRSQFETFNRPWFTTVFLDADITCPRARSDLETSPSSLTLASRSDRVTAMLLGYD